jgi:hypothetical protein
VHEVSYWHLELALQTPLKQSLPTAHILFRAHLLGQLPPQSTSVSLPFCTPSLHEMGWQTLPTHDALAQSIAPRQRSPSPHLGHDPPQSMSVSLPFCTLSVHEKPPHTRFGAVPWQMPVTQSAGTLQCLPEAQAGQVPPPQSTSVSAPSCAPSLQVVPMQTPLVQAPVLQSVPTRQCWGGTQAAHLPPPQSMSVSAPFCTPSAQVGSWQVARQTPLWQSLARLQR